MTGITFAFPPPEKLLSLNDRLHWAVQARIAKAWRTGTHWAARAHMRGHGLSPCTITITLPVNGNRRRDPANYNATAKHIVDGLVDAGLWPDDTPAWVTTTEPLLDPNSALVTITLTPRVEAAA